MDNLRVAIAEERDFYYFKKTAQPDPFATARRIKPFVTSPECGHRLNEEVIDRYLVAES